MYELRARRDAQTYCLFTVLRHIFSLKFRLISTLATWPSAENYPNYVAIIYKEVLVKYTYIGNFVVETAVSPALTVGFLTYADISKTLYYKYRVYKKSGREAP